MKIGVLTIGSELLNGSRLDTNAHWIARNVISHCGEVILKKTTLDSEDNIVTALDYFLKSPVEMILITGGLGPTHDDITASTLYNYFNDEPVFDSSYWEKLKKRFIKKGLEVSNLNKSQALKPKNGEIIPNKLGTARGLCFNNGKIKVIAMPGVPSEMKSMMNETILPMIKRSSNISINYKILKTTGISESKLYKNLKGIINDNPEVDIAFLPSYLGVDIRVTCKKTSTFDSVLNDISAIINNFIYSIDEESLEEVVSNILIENKITISTAESCTGGKIGDRLTNVSGISSVYAGGIIAYSNDQKINILNVKEEILEEHGAVSEETAISMAIGIQKKFSTDIGISTTGIAGPGGGTNKKPVGLVYIGLAYKDILRAYKFNFSHDRISNKMITSQVALNILRNNLLNQINN